MAETVKDKVKNTRRWISWSLAALVASLVQIVISTVVKRY